jgi:outer membrane protein W
MLKKSTLLVALLLTNATLISAQTLSIGPMIGGNVSTFTAISNNKGLIGLSLGGFANYSVNDHFGLGLKVMYAQLGTAFDVNSEHLRLDYVQVPITAVYYFGETGNQFRPKVFAGIYLAPLIKATNKNGDELLGTDGKSAYNNFDFGGLIGAGFNYRIQSRTWLNVDAGLTRGLTDVTKNTTNYQNMSFGINVGVSFPIGKD